MAINNWRHQVILDSVTITMIGNTLFSIKITLFCDASGKQISCMHPQCSNQISQYAICMPLLFFNA